MDMKRYGMVIKLKFERIEEYKKLHAAVWPEVAKSISKSNIRNYSIYLKDETLFSYFENVGSRYEADMEDMAADPVVQRWWDSGKPCMLPI